MNVRASTLAIALTAAVVVCSGVRADGLGEPIVFKGHTLTIRCLAISADGKLLASSGGDNRGRELKLWNVAAGKELGSFADDSNSPEGQGAAGANQLGIRRPFPVYVEPLYTLAFSPDGKLLAGGGSGAVIVWDVADRRVTAHLPCRLEYMPVIAFRADGKALGASGGEESKVWDLGTNRELSSVRRQVGRQTAAFSPDLSALAAANYEEIELYDTQKRELRSYLLEHRGRVHCIAYSADGRTLASASIRNEGEHRYRSQIKVWDAATLQERATFDGPSALIRSLALSPDGKSLALLSFQLDSREDRQLRVLDLPSGRERFRDEGRGRGLMHVHFSANGTLFVAGSPDYKAINLWAVPRLERGK
jgi:WD40 repeat protein